MNPSTRAVLLCRIHDALLLGRGSSGRRGNSSSNNRSNSSSSSINSSSIRSSNSSNSIRSSTVPLRVLYAVHTERCVPPSPQLDALVALARDLESTYYYGQSAFKCRLDLH
mmetsp:Transcript_20794/g.46294  ORF Transcript_20794/g.46294 Transcript_20794/m.46294 type:complete len:111 (-) Transcript_20794:947-1279(-)